MLWRKTPNILDLAKTVFENLHKSDQLVTKFKNDFTHIKATGRAIHAKVRKNVVNLCDLALDYGVNLRKIIGSIFSKSYIENESLIWKYTERKTNRFIARYLKSIGFEENVTITIEGAQLKVWRY